MINGIMLFDDLEYSIKKGLHVWMAKCAQQKIISTMHDDSKLPCGRHLCPKVPL
jgi:hypothetical protein